MENLKAKDAKVLIIGGGGREHAIGLRLSLDGVRDLYFAPGNAGTCFIGQNIDLNLNPKDFNTIRAFIKIMDIDLVVVGPEAPLADGLVDYLRAQDYKVIGPTKAAAQIESSKSFARFLMARVHVPQPDFVVCRSENSAKIALEEYKQFGGRSVVIKVDGLAAGKGAFVCNSNHEIDAAMKAIYADKKFGNTEILVEECLTGTEISVFALCDNSDYVIIGTAQDYKRLLDGDKGPNTGGMGAIAPSPLSTPALMKKVETKIIEPVLRAMKNTGTPFTGFLYCGLMIVNGEPFVIEFNARLGDPETQVILPLIRENFFDLLWLSAHDELDRAQVSLLDISAALVVKVAKGYPDSYPKGEIISGDIDSDMIIHAGTKPDKDGNAVTNGGRVLGVLGVDKNLAKAIKRPIA